MTTPPSEPDPYAGSDGSDQDVRGWTVPAAVPGWSAGQQFYTGPVFDDTGWHIDLSGVDWGPESEPGYDSEPPRQRERPGRRRTTLRFRNHGSPAGNGSAQPAGPADATDRYAQPSAPDGIQPRYREPDGIQPRYREPDGIQPRYREPDGIQPRYREPDRRVV
jgi:hypothetical protein